MMRIILYCLVTALSVCAAAENFTTLDKKIVPEVPARTIGWSGKFVHPNELRPGKYDQRALQTISGLLVSVGTIRTLITFAWAPLLTHLLMTDIDSRVVQFNRAHLRYIKELSERYQDNVAAQRTRYMANLLGYEPSDGEVIAWAEQGKSVAELQVLIKEKKGVLNKFDQQNWFMNSEFNLTWTEQHLSLENLYGYQRVADEKFFWEDDIQWKKIIEALHSERIAVTNLSLTEDLTSLGAFVDDLNVDFGALDVSNIPTFQGVQINPWKKELDAIKPTKVLYTVSTGMGDYNYLNDEFARFLGYLEFGIYRRY